MERARMSGLGEREWPLQALGYDGKIHPERVSPSQWRAFRLRKAQRLGTHSAAQWIELRDRVGCCVACGVTDVPLAKDHIIPLAGGGCDCIENIQPLCQPCNSSKGARLP